MDIDPLADSPRLKKLFEQVRASMDADAQKAAAESRKLEADQDKYIADEKAGKDAKEQAANDARAEETKIVSDGKAEAEAAHQVELAGKRKKLAETDAYFSEYAAIRTEDASALRSLSIYCANNDAPSGDCMNQVARARKIDERMRTLIGNRDAAKFLAEQKLVWRPESPMRAAAVKMPLEANAGVQAARDYQKAHSFRNAQGGFMGCGAARAALTEARGESPNPAADIEQDAGFLWDQDKAIRDLAAIERSGAAGSPENAFRICVLRARWAELQMQKDVPPPKAAAPVAPAMAMALPRRTSSVALTRLSETLSPQERLAREQQRAETGQTVASEHRRMKADADAVLGAVADVAMVGAQTYVDVKQQQAQIAQANALARQQAAAQQAAAASAVQRQQQQAAAGQQAMMAAAVPKAPPAPDLSKVHDASLEATQCVQIVNAKAAGINSTFERHFKNNCGYPVSVLSRGSANGADGGLFNIKAYSSYPVTERDPIRYSACRGLNTMQIQGDRHWCRA